MLTESQQQSIRDFLEGRYIPSGLGTEESACSIASINLALYGKLTDEIPDCMSEVIGNLIIGIQDSMPDEIRNSDRWRSLLPLAAGTGRERESERLDLLLEWIYGKVLPTLQPLADANGFGAVWRQMCEIRTKEAAAEAVRTAWAAEAAWAAWAAWAAEAAAQAAWAAEAAAQAAWAAWAAARAAQTAQTAARAAQTAQTAWALAETPNVDFWNKIDPCEILEKMIKI